MRKAIIVRFPILAIALIAALAALWPLSAWAGPAAQIVAPASIQSIAFANSPSADDYAAGEQIRITVTFDRSVTVTGQPKIALAIGRQQPRATYAQGSGSTSLTFSYTVQASDWDGNGVSVPAGSIELSGGSIIDSNDLAVSRTHTGIADDASRKVKGSADTNPSFGTAAISAQTYPKGAAITDLTLPAATGGNGLLGYSFSPAPPDGLAFNAATRTLSGAPTTTQNAVTYTYAAIDGDQDTVSLAFTITVDGTPSFPGTATTLAAQTYATGAAITSLTLPAATGGNTPLAYALSPALPDGLVFNAAARTISGTPTTAQNAVTYTYTVTDADGDTDRRTISITVDGTPAFPADAVSAQTYAKGTAITSLTLPAATNGNTPLAYALTPALPDGLVFNATTRVISGTPTTTQNAAAYAYTATDADGDTATHSFTITVDGTPSFSADAVAAQTYPRGAAITSLTLPAAADGNTPLTYSISPTPPDGLTFNAATRTLSGTPTLGQAATTYTYTVTDANGDTATKSFTIAITGDYDLDDDGLIEIDRLAQLNAVRWDLNGDGAVDTGTSVADTAKYSTAYPSPATGMGCLRDHDDDATTDKIAGCIGYELTQNLDFDTDGDGTTYTVSSAGVVTGDAGDAYYNGGKGWKPIGTWTYQGPATERFTATFDGNGKTISNLFIKDASAFNAGLFGSVGSGGRIKRLGVLNLNVTGLADVGGLAGINQGTISVSYATGTITADTRLGGLVGSNSGTISGSYSISSVSGSGSNGGGLVGGLVGISRGTINASYATGPVASSRSHVGGLVGENAGTISGSYATGSVITTGNREAGGLAGRNRGNISASYATGSVTGPKYVGGLVGANGGGGAISSSYATGSVTGTTSVGGLVGINEGPISDSYATGSVTGTTSVGGLVGYYIFYTITNSYWNTETTGQATSAGGIGKTTSQLQSPTGYTGIYANWNVNLDGVAGNDDPWDFGASSQYPTLKYGGLIPAKQRPITISVQSVNGNIPIVGGPVTATPDLAVSAGITWQWQSSADGATWADIANAASRTYIPVAADAASGGKYLRVKASFTAWGERRTATSARTAKVVSDSTAPSTAATSVPIVGAKLRYYLSAAGATHRTAWQWRRCDDAAMTSNCVLRSQSNSASDAHTEYTPVAGADSDVGKYLQAYAYYAANDAGKTWTRAESPVLGPVVASPAATP